MYEDRGVTHPLQQGQNFDRRRDFLKTKFMDMDTYDTETHGKWRCILWRSRAFKIIFQICGT